MKFKGIEGLFVAMVAAPLLVGSVHTEIILGLLVVAWGVWVLERPRRVSIPSVAFGLLAGICLFQVVPVPGIVHEWGNPAGEAIYREGWQALFGISAGDGWRSLSLDPGRTADRGLRWLVLAIVAALGAMCGRRNGGWETLCRVVVAAGLAVTAVGAVQSWSGAEQVLFVYEPTVSLPGYTTFVSDNHAAAFAGLASLAGFYLAFRAPRRGSVEGLLSAGAALGLMVLMFEFGSAGTTLGFVLAMGVFLMLFVGTGAAGEWVPAASGRRGIRGAGAALIAAPVVAAGLLRFGPASWRELLWQTHLGEWLQRKAMTRVEMIRASLEATGDFWLLGVGGGATERVLPPYVDWSVTRPATIATIENEPVEWLLHYGVPAGLVAVALLVGYGWYLARRFRRRRQLRDAAALSLFVYVAVLAQFHFPLFALGIAVPAVALLEGLSAPSDDAVVDSQDGGSKVDFDRGYVAAGPVATRLLVAASLVMAGWFAVGYVRHDVDVHAAGDEASERTEREYARLVELIPADGDLYMRAALSAREAGDDEAAVRRAEFAFEREPTAKMAAYLAGLYQSVGRTEEARSMYRRVFDGSYAEVPGLWIRFHLVRDFPEPGAIAEILEDAPERHWRTAARILRRERGPDAAARFGLALHELRPEAFLPNEIVVEHYLKMDRAFLAETWIREMMAETAETAPRRDRQIELLVRVLRAQGKNEAANEACERLEGWLEQTQCKNE